MSEVRTRFAPSPTGYLHLGSVRTAFYCWLHARHTGGKFLVRIEDTDAERSTEASGKEIIEGLEWLGITSDEPIVYQSQRVHLYKHALDALWSENKIYPAFETREELDAARAKAETEKRTYVYDGKYATLPRDEAEKRMRSGETFIWRLRVDATQTTVVHESLMSDHGTVEFANSEIGDFPLTRSGNHNAPGWPLYNFCNVIDDNDQRITHVIRGVEHLGNTPRQVLIYNALGYPVPSFTHLPLIMRNGKKMSKRDTTDPKHSVSIHERRELGYVKEAIVNYLALLGWGFSETEEFATPLDMAKVFDVTRLTKSNASFDEDKFLHFNAWYIRHLPLHDIVERTKPFLVKAGLSIDATPPAQLENIIGLAVERARLLADFPDLVRYFFETPTTYDADAAAKNFKPETADMFFNIVDALVSLHDFSAGAIDEAIKKHLEEKGLKAKDVMPALRLALTGRGSSPGSVFDNMALLGRPTTVARLDAAIQFIKKS
ncbi:MAG: glutamate--tRNA ligase [Bdellovibrionales bacterium]